MSKDQTCGDYSNVIGGNKPTLISIKKIQKFKKFILYDQTYGYYDGIFGGKSILFRILDFTCIALRKASVNLLKISEHFGF